MNSDQIKEYVDGAVEAAIKGREIATRTLPLWEIAYQLALMNERNVASDTDGVNQLLRKVGLEPTKEDS